MQEESNRKEQDFRRRVILEESLGMEVDVEKSTKKDNRGGRKGGRIMEAKENLQRRV